MSLDTGLQRVWYGPKWLALPLLPLAWAFGALIALRRFLYRTGVFRRHQVDVPVVVVGNVTVGGTGKTPVAAWIARQLRLRGRRVGVVLRGYGGSHRGAPRRVQLSDNPAIVGDEALLHVHRGAEIVVIGGDRVAAAELARNEGAEVVVCDDGLQHLRLERDVEIAVVDGARGLGNGWLLPAGPLREPASRLESVHAIVQTERGAPSRPIEARGPLHVTARMQLGEAVRLISGERRPLASFAAMSGLHAVAAVGNPEAFFTALRAAGLQVTGHALRDHAVLDGTRLPFPRQATVLMTEKDAVKCGAFSQPDWWWVDLEVNLDRTDSAALLTSILERTGLTGAGAPIG
jgi:tetraacyldisaccharide 4'-kinase